MRQICYDRTAISFVSCNLRMNFFRQYISPALILLLFLFALVAVSARIFLPTDLSGPAPLTGLLWHAFAPLLGLNVRL